MSDQQPLGEPTDFTGAARPDGSPLSGEHVLLRALDPARDAVPMYRVSHEPDGDPRIWTYLPDGPYPDLSSYRASLEAEAASSDPLFYAVVPATTGLASGQISYCAITPEHGSIEIGYIWFSPSVQRTAVATEAIFLTMRHAFDDLGYRRFEWKCNALNAPSRAAAERFGFQFEGVFAQHRVVKGRNRDTAWFAVTDARWPEVRAAFEAWLAPTNFDASGNQLRSLRSLRSG